MKIIAALTLMMCLLPSGVRADDDAAAAEIDYLLRSIGSSGCAFVRNGKRHDSGEAEDHLRMKYRKAKRYASTSEKFIDRLASKSSLSRKPYFIECEGDERIASGEWLVQLLIEYRAGSHDERRKP